MNINTESKSVKRMMALVQHYNHEKYWKMRSVVVDPNSSVPKFIRLIYLYKIKKSDAFNNASFGTDLGAGAIFDAPPILPHHTNGIIVSHFAHIGTNCAIYQQVTIAQNEEDDDAPVVGNDCLIGAGAKIIGKVHIGNNVKIGANAVVVNDIPDNSVAAGIPARVVKTIPEGEVARVIKKITEKH